MIETLLASSQDEAPLVAYSGYNLGSGVPLGLWVYNPNDESTVTLSTVLTTAAQFSPDGSILAAIHSTTLTIYRVSDWAVIFTLQSASFAVPSASQSANELIFSRDGAYLATSVVAQVCQIFRTSDWSIVRTHDPSYSLGSAITFSLDSQFIIAQTAISTGAAYTLQKIRLDTGALLGTLALLSSVAVKRLRTHPITGDILVGASGTSGNPHRVFLVGVEPFAQINSMSFATTVTGDYTSVEFIGGDAAPTLVLATGSATIPNSMLAIDIYPAPAIPPKEETIATPLNSGGKFYVQTKDNRYAAFGDPVSGGLGRQSYFLDTQGERGRFGYHQPLLMPYVNAATMQNAW